LPEVVRPPVRTRFRGVTTDSKLTSNARPKLLLRGVGIFTHPSGDVTLKCVGHTDVVRGSRCQLPAWSWVSTGEGSRPVAARKGLPAVACGDP